MLEKQASYVEQEGFWESKAQEGEFSGFLIPGASAQQEHLFGTYRLTKELRTLKELLARHTPSSKKKAILDVGCATGNFIEFFLSHADRVDAFDFSKTYASLSQKRFAHKTNVRVSCSSLLDYSPDRVYDVIFVGGVLCYVLPEDLPQAINQLKKWLSDDGVIIFREPVMSKVTEQTWSKNGQACTYRRTPTELAAEFEALGLSVLEKQLNGAYSFVTLLRFYTRWFVLPLKLYLNPIVELVAFHLPLVLTKMWRKNMPLDYFFVCKK
jgi:SAM-dependent methyltransferase